VIHRGQNLLRQLVVSDALGYQFRQIDQARLIDNMGNEPVDGRHNDVFIGLLGSKSRQPEATQFSLEGNAVGSQDFKEGKEVACSCDKYAISP